MIVFSSLIDALLEEHHVLSLSVSLKGQHWAAPLFYVLDAPRSRLLFVTDLETIHGRMLLETGAAAVTVSGQDSNIATLRGLQMWGRADKIPPQDIELASYVYNQAFVIPSHLKPIYWSFSPISIKATDNRKYFGYKEKWGNDLFIDG